MNDLPWEDSLLERKTQSDLTDLLKTLVAFANSVRPGRVATILIGEKDDGSVQGVDNADKIQKTVRDLCDNKIYPPIQCHSQAYEKDGKTCVRVEIEYDGETPHFGGVAWVRRGSETVKATNEVFQRLIDFRSSKIKVLAEHLNRDVTIEQEIAVQYNFKPQRHHYNSDTATIRFVNGFWITFEVNERRISEPLAMVTLNWDDDRERLKIIVES